MTDYAVLILSNLAMHEDFLTAKEIASATHISLPTVKKLLKKLNKKGLVNSRQGVLGGYTLHTDAKTISIALLLNALEGNLSLTQCASESDKCSVEDFCQIGNAWQLINQRVFASLDDLTLMDLIKPQRIEHFLSTSIPVRSSTVSYTHLTLPTIYSV